MSRLARLASLLAALALAGCWNWDVYRDGHDATTPPGAYPVVFHTTPEGAFVAPDGAVRALRGFDVFLLSGGERVPEQARFDAIRAAGFDAVRVGLTWSTLEPTRGRFDSTSLAVVDAAVARAKAAGLYVVLLFIRTNPLNALWRPSWTSATTLASGDEPDAYIRMLATRFANEPAVAAYDPIDAPPVPGSSSNVVLARAERTIGLIRAVAPDKIVIVQPPYGETALIGADFGLLRSTTNVVFGIQDFYAGGAGAGFDSSGGIVSGKYTWDGAYNGSSADLARHLQVHLNNARTLGVPLWITAFGVRAGTANWEQWIDDQVALFASRGLGYAWYRYACAGDGFSAANGNCDLLPFTARLLPR